MKRYTPSDMGGNKITNLATPTASTDAVTKAYADAISVSGGSFAGCRLYFATNLLVPHATPTVIPWTNESYDTDGFHDTVTDNTRVTIPTGFGGKYRIHSQLRWQNSSAGSYREIKIRKNGTTDLARNRLGAFSTTAYLYVQVDDTQSLDDGDYIEIYVDQDTGGNLDAYSDDSTQGYLTLERVGLI